MNYTNTTDVFLTDRYTNYTPVIVICGLSGIVSCMLCVYYNIALYRYVQLSEAQKLAHYYTIYELVSNRKVGVIQK
jgi:hypothetical protein